MKVPASMKKCITGNNVYVVDDSLYCVLTAICSHIILQHGVRTC